MVFITFITSHPTLDCQSGLARREPKPPSHFQLWRESRDLPGRGWEKQ